ncbi:efflux RND transporter periplasmic adaptor subunit [Flavobacterium potami]|uniref:efflux RND transporter periplasmic adaptor subunit n=1 Tax=Flavobacterium potami TaxID=2872310 RepID=UPI001CBBCD59|nr:efflux RND transporter periplasmic adaptor subunit [Flavobacterium potami]
MSTAGLNSCTTETALAKAILKKSTLPCKVPKHNKNYREKIFPIPVYSPISGILLRKLAEPGEIVSTATPVLVVTDINRVKVNAYIPENQLSQIRIGQEAQVLVGALGETFTGKVTEVGRSADVTTRAFTVKIEVPNPKHNIRPGMIAEVQLAFLLHTILKWQKFLQMI